MGNMTCRTEGPKRSKYLKSNELKRSFIKTQKKRAKIKSESPAKKIKFKENIFLRDKSPNRGVNVTFLDVPRVLGTGSDSSDYDSEYQLSHLSRKADINEALGFVGHATEIFLTRQLNNHFAGPTNISLDKNIAEISEYDKLKRSKNRRKIEDEETSKILLKSLTTKERNYDLMLYPSSLYDVNKITPKKVNFTFKSELPKEEKNFYDQIMQEEEDSSEDESALPSPLASDKLSLFGSKIQNGQHNKHEQDFLTIDNQFDLNSSITSKKEDVFVARTRDIETWPTEITTKETQNSEIFTKKVPDQTKTKRITYEGETKRIPDKGETKRVSDEEETKEIDTKKILLGNETSKAAWGNEASNAAWGKETSNAAWGNETSNESSKAQKGNESNKAQRGNESNKAQRGNENNKAQRGNESNKAQRGDESNKAQMGNEAPLEEKDPEKSKNKTSSSSSKDDKTLYTSTTKTPPSKSKYEKKSYLNKVDSTPILRKINAGPSLIKKPGDPPRNGFTPETGTLDQSKSNISSYKKDARKIDKDYKGHNSSNVIKVDIKKKTSQQTDPELQKSMTVTTSPNIRANRPKQNGRQIQEQTKVANKSMLAAPYDHYRLMNDTAPRIKTNVQENCKLWKRGESHNKNGSLSFRYDDTIEQPSGVGSKAQTRKSILKIKTPKLYENWEEEDLQSRLLSKTSMYIESKTSSLNTSSEYSNVQMFEEPSLKFKSKRTFKNDPDLSQEPFKIKLKLEDMLAKENIMNTQNLPPNKAYPAVTSLYDLNYLNEIKRKKAFNTDEEEENLRTQHPKNNNHINRVLLKQPSTNHKPLFEQKSNYLDPVDSDTSFTKTITVQNIIAKNLELQKSKSQGNFSASKTRARVEAREEFDRDLFEYNQAREKIEFNQARKGKNRVLFNLD